MRSVPRSRLEVIRLAHPNARITIRDGKEVVIIPTYDSDTDESGETILGVHDDIERKPQIGDILTDPRTGATFEIKDPMSLIPIRKGPKAQE